MSESTRSSGKSALTFIFLTVLIDVTGLGIIVPILPQLIQSLTGGSLSDAGAWAGWLASSFSISLFLFAPIIGGLSDQFGRRPVLLLALFGFGMDYLLQGFAPSLIWLFIGRILAGVCGTSFTVAAAYIADVSPPDRRAQNFGLIGAAFGLGFILGPALGALLGQYGIRVPFFGAAVLALLNLLFGLFVVPESLDQEHRRSFNWRRANPFGTLQVLFRYPVIKSFIMSLFLVYMAQYALQSTWSFYTMEKFQWDGKMIGLSLTLVGLMATIVQGGLSRMIIPRLGSRRSILLAFSIGFAGYLAFAFANQGWIMFAITIPFALSGLAGPSIQGLISNQVPVNAQGELQGGMTGLMSITAILGPLMMTRLFSYFTSGTSALYFPGAPFFMAALLVLSGILLILKPLSKFSSK